MFFQELVQQHRIHCFIPHGVSLALFIARDQVGIHFLYFFGDKAELRNLIRIKLVLVTEGHRLQAKESLRSPCPSV